MSWDAEAKATIKASPANNKGPSRGELKAIAEMPITRMSWVMTIHPLLLPSHGGTKRSMSGAHKNFSVYGIPTSANMPIVRKSTPDTVIQACRVAPVKAKGSPEEKPRNVIMAILRLRNTRR
jgi:hypothetical protein